MVFIYLRLQIRLQLGMGKMRLIATSDTHFDFKPEWVPDGDVFIHAGDFMLSGYVDEWYKRVECFKALPHKLKILVAGNHDLHMQLYPGSALWDLKNAGVHILGYPTKSDTYTLPNGMRMLGLPWVHNLPNWAFNKTEEQLEDYMEHCKRADIVVSHCPPAGILDERYGIKAYRKYLEEYEPNIWICGHIHERGGEQQTVNRTTVYNVAAMDREYNMAHAPLVLEL